MEDIIGPKTDCLIQYLYLSVLKGLDGTDAFLEAHGDDRTVMKVLAGLAVGDLDDEAGLLDAHSLVSAQFLSLQPYALHLSGTRSHHFSRN